MLVYISNLDSLYELTKIPNELIHVLIESIFLLIFFMIILLIASGLILPRPKNQGLIDKLMSVFIGFYLKTLSMFVNIAIMLVLMFVAMQALFEININIIVTLYQCRINKELFKALVGPIVAISTLSFSVLGALWSRSPLQDIFDEIKSKIPKLFEKIQSYPEYSSIILIIAFEMFLICVELIF